MRDGIGVILHALITVSAVVSIPTSLTSLTLYTAKKNWNEARFICESLGGSLVYIKDTEKKALIDTLVAAEPWKSTLGFSGSFLIGLYNKGDSDPGVYSWLDCEELGTWKDWKSFQPFFEGELKCAVKSSSGWSSADCDDDNMYVCETVGGACVYEVVEDTQGVDNSPYDVGAIPASQCQTYCDTAISNGEECWAFTWSMAKCQLHFTYDSTYFNNTANTVNSVGEHLYKKKCIAGLVSSTDYPLMTMSSAKPYSTCPGSVGSGNGMVYTLYNTNLTWADARLTCEGIGQRLVVLNTSQDGLKLQEVYGNFSATFWLGLNGSDADGFYWLDGADVVWDEFGSGESPVGSETLCVAEAPSINTWTTHSCQEERPFACQQMDGKCMYESVADTQGINGNDEGSNMRSVCQEICNSNTDCIGYWYKFLLFSHQCHTYVTMDQDYLYKPANLVTVSNSELHRWTCSVGLIFDDVPLIGEQLQGVNVKELSSSSSVTMETSSIDISSEPSLGESGVIMETSLAGEYSATTETSSMETSSGWFLEGSSVTIETSVPATLELSSALMTSYQKFTSTVEMFETTAYNIAEVTSSTGTSFLDYLDSTFVYPEDMSATNTGYTIQSATSEITVQTPSLEILSETMISTTQILDTLTDMGVILSSVTCTGQAIILSSLENNDISSHLSEVATQPSILQTSATESDNVMTTSDSVQMSSASPPTTESLSSTAVTTLKPSASTLMTYCSCRCNVPTTLNETSSLIQEIKEKLLLEKAQLKREVRRRTSAQDERESSKSMGYVAITFLAVVLGFMLLSDVGILFSNLQMLLGNVKR